MYSHLHVEEQTAHPKYPVSTIALILRVTTFKIGAPHALQLLRRDDYS